MQLDNTRIAVRERGLLDIFDLALQVTREYFKPLCLTFGLLAIPLMLLNDLLIGWMLEGEDREVFFFMDELESILRFWWNMTCLVFLQAPLASILTTKFLGEAVFVERPSYRKIITDVGRLLPRVLWCQLLVRGVLPAWLLYLLIDREDEPNLVVEVLLLGGLALYVAFLRAFRPFINEIVLLERAPLVSRQPTAITIGKRTTFLHSPSGGDLFGRWLMTAALGVLLTASVFGTLWFGYGVLFNNWQPGRLGWRFLYPAALWSVAGFLAVVRFLGYLDLRIRHEGWEVELRLRAEAARQAAKLT